MILFFDGACHLCSREMDYFRPRLTGPFEMIDIADPHFEASRYGLDPAKVHEVMHVKVGDEMRTGVSAFTAIWERVPSWRWMARLARCPGMPTLLNASYYLFAKIRPWLPRRKVDHCSSGTCRR
jgi:predicted DCC family thiol-disulfide oxidoreductase YuxK